MSKAEDQRVLTHPFEPVYDPNCTRLVLGSFPSVASRAQGFYYGHPRNRFWPLLALLYAEPVPGTVPEKKAFLLRHRIALWDAAAECELTGSADSSIRSAVPNDISSLLIQTSVRSVYCNGQTSFRIYESLRKQSLPGLLPPAVPLPSTSPANAAWTLEQLHEAWLPLLEEPNG